MTAPVMAGAEPFSAPGGNVGALVLHGFTGNPFEMRPVAERLAAAGYAVELPRLPGHGTALEDMIPTRWADWSGTVESTYAELAGRTEKVVVVGLSMGGALALSLAERHPEIAGIVAINPVAEPPGDELREAVHELLASGDEVMAGIGSDIARPDVTQPAYEGTPLAPALSLFEAVEDVAVGLPSIHCPVLLLSSREDHVVPSSNGDLVAATVSGPVERIWLERSYHVATLDFDAELIETKTVEFVGKVTAGTAP
ncbi:MAG TPA: alpha/beta fold hydrolase [Acidimicrobiales bacterium]|nr:alpha/beta fold hydrolase [Acidimicrobiales bacterium]